MTLHERITAALDAIPGGGHWRWSAKYDRYSGKWGVRAEFEPDEFVTVAQHVPLESEAWLIAAAPGLLTEAAERLNPQSADIERVIEQVRFEAQWDASRLLSVAADLLEQAFLDPQETP